MKKLKVISLGLMLICVVVMGCTGIISVNADDEDDSNAEVVELEDVLEDKSIEVIGKTEYVDSNKLGDVDIDTAIVLNDIAVPLFPTYDNNEEALNRVKEDCSMILKQLEKVYDLEPLSSSNWVEYYRVMYEYLNDENKEEWYTQDNKEFLELDEFFDIYENTNSNYKIEEYIKENNSIDDLKNDSEFVNNLPYDSVEVLKEKYDFTENETITRAAFNVGKAVSYAEKYAKNPNTSKFKTCKSDCTNFASQIAYYAGKKMTDKWYAKKGHVVNKDKYVNYSTQWCNANSFVNKWGYDCEYVSHRSFSLYLKKGCFITYDKQDDGDWDHVGFVCDVKKFSNKLGYADYKVAQHTRNYLNWTSSDNNGWDQLKKDYKKLVFAIVNIN